MLSCYKATRASKSDALCGQPTALGASVINIHYDSARLDYGIGNNMVRKLELDSGVRTSYMYQVAYPLRLRREALEKGRSTRIPSVSIAGTGTEGLKTKVRAMIDGQTFTLVSVLYHQG